MGLNLTVSERRAIWAEAQQTCPPVTSIDGLETTVKVPSQLGKGYKRQIEISPYLDIFIYHGVYWDLTEQIPENEHPVQFAVPLSGIWDSDLVLINSQQSYVGGSGIQRQLQHFMPQCETQLGVNIIFDPNYFQQAFATDTEDLPVPLKPLLQGHDWQKVFSPKTTKAMRSVVQQIIDCPFLGSIKRLYLESKAKELAALQLNAIEQDYCLAASPSLKPDTMARVYDAAEILISRLDYPPSQVQLAQIVGTSERTLRRGFKAIFKQTVWEYLTEQRLKKAETLLRDGNLSVTDVAYRTGYSNMGHFAAAFKRRFGITPKQCRKGEQLNLS